MLNETTELGFELEGEGTGKETEMKESTGTCLLAFPAQELGDDLPVEASGFSLQCLQDKNFISLSPFSFIPEMFAGVYLSQELLWRWV